MLKYIPKLKFHSQSMFRNVELVKCQINIALVRNLNQINRIL